MCILTGAFMEGEEKDPCLLVFMTLNLETRGFNVSINMKSSGPFCFRCVRKCGNWNYVHSYNGITSVMRPRFYCNVMSSKLEAKNEVCKDLYKKLPLFVTKDLIDIVSRPNASGARFEK